MKWRKCQQNVFCIVESVCSNSSYMLAGKMICRDRPLLFCLLFSIIINGQGTSRLRCCCWCTADMLKFLKFLLPLQLSKLPDSHGSVIFQSLLQSAEKHLVLTNICCLPKRVMAPKHIICINSERQHVIHCFCGFFLLFCRGHQLSRRTFTVFRGTLVFRLL